jgi:hypothetical protein
LTHTCNRRDWLSDSSILAFQRVDEFIPESVPLIVEAVIDESVQ